jgi:hypothetical protein
MYLLDRVKTYQGVDVTLEEELERVSLYRMTGYRTHHPKYLIFKGLKLLATAPNKVAAHKLAHKLNEIG